MQRQFYRIADLVEILGVSKWTIMRMTAAGDFPKRVKLGKRAVGYRITEIHDWLEQRQDSPQNTRKAA